MARLVLERARLPLSQGLVYCQTRNFCFPWSDKSQLTVGFDLPVVAFDHFTQVWPLREVVKIEADVVGFCQVVEIATVEME